jgi:eukaryotic-like serine/threonine-protein kinase
MGEGTEETRTVNPDGTAGTVIGRYHLLQMIGEGGMGEVWLAEQKQPVRRRVALKLIKAGMNTREVAARFESERQALALMDHPAIAKVFDAGSTSQGAPYFVMEHVAGVPITSYCDKHRLTTRERLELFVRVCEGVQHAHQKAIIHRDLKPSNILVTEVDGRPAPKIIDFGVAKAVAQKLTAETMFTRVGALIGTPEYMSPEHANSAAEDIDTRTDVYSLGIIFYSCWPGRRPIGAEYFMTRLQSWSDLQDRNQNNLRYTAGINFTFRAQ